MREHCNGKLRKQGNNNTSYKRTMLTIVAGRKRDYWKHTIASWCREVKELPEYEYGIRVIVLTREENSILPRVYVGNLLAFEGVLGEVSHRAIKKSH